MIEEITLLEKMTFSLSLGLGLIASGVFFLGIMGLYIPWMMITWIIILAIWSRNELISSLRNIPNFLRTIISRFKAANYQGKGLIVISAVIFFLTYLQAMTPVWDYDGLMYHLEGPRQFLEASRILILQYPYQANGPMLIEMLYAIPVAFGMEPLAKLIHMTFGILLILATYSLGERLLGNRKGWLPAAILLASPMVVALAGFAYTDLGLAVYTLLGMYSILIWSQTRRKSWLISAGIFTGFMIGTKYLALGYFFIFILILLWLDRRTDRRTRVVHILLFGGIALLIGFPWYLKNWVYSGNPVFPLYFGGPGWSLARVQLSSIFIAQFGTGKKLLDYLLLPINLYIHQEKFSTFLGSKETISPLFIFVLVIPFLRNKSRTLVITFVFTIMAFLFWALTSQQIRLLLPLFPFLSILASKVLIEITRPIKSKKLNNILIPGVMGGLLVFILLIFGIYLININPIKVVLGTETQEEFLSRLSDHGWVNYKAINYIQNHLDDNHIVLMIWDAASYYCGSRCIPDIDFSQLAYIFEDSEDMNVFSDQINELGTTHILVNWYVVNSFMQNYRNSQTLTNSEILSYNFFTFLKLDFLQSCSQEVYRDQYEAIYELTC